MAIFGKINLYNQIYYHNFSMENSFNKHQLLKLKNQSMKRFTLTILAILSIAAAVSAQTLSDLSPSEIKSLDLSGKYVGKRHQYNQDKKTIMQSFEYEFNLTQKGDIISGTSTIIKANGEYADIKLRGVIVGNKLYFEEYEIINQNKNQDMVWCFKSGALNIKKDVDQLKLVGPTESYMAEYYIPCTGGITDLVKVDNSNNFKKEDATAPSTLDASINLAVSPNPFVDATKINYSISSNANVTLEVYDIQGRKVAVLENNAAKVAGVYSVDFSAKNNGLSAGILIAKLSVNGQVYSSEMVQMK